MMKVVMSMLVDVGTHVDDFLLFGTMLDGISMLPNLSVEKLGVLLLTGMLLVHVGHGDNLFMMNFRTFLDMPDGLDVVLDWWTKSLA